MINSGYILSFYIWPFSLPFLEKAINRATDRILLSMVKLTLLQFTLYNSKLKKIIFKIFP